MPIKFDTFMVIPAQAVAACVITAISHLDTGPVTIFLAQGFIDCNAMQGWLGYLAKAFENLLVNRVCQDFVCVLLLRYRENISCTEIVDYKYIDPPFLSDPSPIIGNACH